MKMLLFVFLSFLNLSIATVDVASCSCGFLDVGTGAVWTDAIIAYANETATVPADSLVAEEFQHPYEKNWNARYRAGASVSNVCQNESTAPGWNGTAWVLKLNKPTRDHAVVGASLRSLRRDIQYGTFESVLGPPKPGVGGSVLSMRLDYNESQTVNLNVMNADDPKDAWTSFMIYGDWRGTRYKGVNFTDFGNSTYNFKGSPWGFVPYRIQWNDTKVNFFIGDALVRSVNPHDTFKRWPTTPSALYIQHSSIGDIYTSQGPPPNGSYARLGMLRAFFNSSLMTPAEHLSFDKRCPHGPTCLVSDISLRGSSPYIQAATLPFKEKPIDYKKRWPALFTVSVSLTISTLVLVHALIKRISLKKEPTVIIGRNEIAAASTTTNSSRRTSRDFSITHSMIFTESGALTRTAQFPGISTPGQVTSGASGTTTPRTLALSSYFPEQSPAWLETGPLEGDNPISWPFPSMPTTPGSSSLHGPARIVRHETHGSHGTQTYSTSFRKSLEISIVNEKAQVATGLDEKKLPQVTVKETQERRDQISKGAFASGSTAPIAAPKQRVDYLAGLVSLASILVTLIHFSLTFLPATEIPYTHAHYESEVWALKIVTPYLLTFSWIGPFFTSSTRFLVGSYLKSGDLKTIAEKTVGRTPRLIIPCAAIAALEYFCMQVGAIFWLEYLPSVTWSTWPYTSNYVTFGHFISEILELMYVIPNAVPQITFNYCIGVLWTIPVQLQNSWLSLLGVIVIREIKTPWKRMGYYTFCILMHWYAMSWGSFFWVGLLIADLDITYKWKTWLYTHPFVYYPFITVVAIVAIGSPSIDLAGMWKTLNFNTLEFGVHPHQRTGHLVRETVDYGYPPYYLPRLTALTFSIGFHLLVELSTTVQKFFSNRLFMWLFPHILTMYLIHGLIFWSLGAVICTHLAAHGVPYWANMLVVATCSYAVIFGCLPFVTPIIETLGKSITQKIWQDASTEPPRRRKTFYPFSPALLKGAEQKYAEVVSKSRDVERNEFKAGVAL